MDLDKCVMTCFYKYSIIYSVFILFFKIERKYYIILLAALPLIAVNV